MLAAQLPRRAPRLRSSPRLTACCRLRQVQAVSLLQICAEVNSTVLEMWGGQSWPQPPVFSGGLSRSFADKVSCVRWTGAAPYICGAGKSRILWLRPCTTGSANSTLRLTCVRRDAQSHTPSRYPKVVARRWLAPLKGFTAYRVNELLGSHGHPFWHEESYDHLVRSQAQFGRVRSYIEDRPVKAGLVREVQQHAWSSATSRLKGGCGQYWPPHIL
jgi:hypothetical protein